MDYHHSLPFAAVWGDGSFASSDAQRVAVEGSSLLASFYPRYFGFYERAVGVYTHISDQHSVFASRVISCAPREALYVLDGLLENDTVLEPREHTTERTAPPSSSSRSATCSGSRSCRGSRISRTSSFIASSLRDRSSPAHVVVDRLAANASDRPAKALTMLGRIVRTTFILRYLHDAKLRDRVQLQLNRGEGRHALSKRISFGNQGVYRTGDVDELMNKVSALSVLSNAVLVWNTIRIAEIVQALEAASGQPVAREDLARVSPLLSARLLVSGRYNFDRATPPDP